MKSVIGSTMLLLSAGRSAFASVAPVPEIDATTGAAALALLAGGILVLRSRRNKRPK